MLPWCQKFGKYVENLEESSSWETFHPTSAMKKFSIDKSRCITEEKTPHSQKSFNSVKLNGKSFGDDDSYNEEENNSENGVDKGHLFYNFK